MIINFLKYAILAFVFIAFCQCDSQTTNAPTDQQAVQYPFRHESFKTQYVSAHRATTHLDYMPENAIESIEALYKAGINWVECDVQTTADGKLVLFHDDNLDDKSTGNGRLDDKSLKELQRLNLICDGEKTEYRIPDLNSVLEFAKQHPDLILQLDVKRNTDFKVVLDLVERHDLLKSIVFIVYSVPAAEAVHRISQEVIISIPVRNMDEWHRLQNSNVPLNRVIAFTGTIRSTSDLYDVLHDHNIPAIFGTLGNIDQQAISRGDRIYEQLIDDGVDIFATDRPIHVHSFINK